jgi:hypothetical protein
MIIGNMILALIFLVGGGFCFGLCLPRLDKSGMFWGAIFVILGAYFQACLIGSVSAF